ncbi:hypothetical protein HPHPP26_0094 [Helicobacter pylori Hp P-26]|nr:hypothetical protein HPHPP26_0094 [Helicobacter pylori Hp P-26]
MNSIFFELHFFGVFVLKSLFGGFFLKPFVFKPFVFWGGFDGKSFLAFLTIS